ncbi:ABC transporter ATP-binding protein [Christiangramia sabulilitoris]|uniref:ABC transporter ATP-binding protein n=1 Tax=Christiangramia sabulilitoris TaxID=2583991 RepID=A0A550HZD9_9FLAO|nr:ABC transporter ATP-binding protein [Christiangramia sabulilitoris]TRO63928.1 ABC transporter ATP-binding protein [Christiangramia sabulilitoris]
MSSILKAENISKQYRLGLVGTGTISDDLKRWWYNIRGKEDPFLKVGAVNDRGAKAREDYVWALKDINFEVKPGEVLGIIGKNGAGKSTLLKILSRVTSPTTGSIKTKGRIASLLEVGTGFHGELTGRENIYLNGAILGMTKPEINSKIDEIIDFSGCEMYIDTPVKRYSSGMTVRLGFAVAAHLEPEILVVDEVLAVGDAEFQKKAIGKMQDLSTGEGRTVLFVSHNMNSVQSLCTSAMLLERGIVSYCGDTHIAISKYLSGGEISISDFSNLEDRSGNGDIKFKKLELVNQCLNTNVFKLGDELKFNFHLIIGKQVFEKIRFLVGIYNERGEGILRFDSDSQLDLNLNSGNLGKDLYITCSVKEKLNIIPGRYSVNIAVFTGSTLQDHIANKIFFDVVNDNYLGSNKTMDSHNLAKVIYKTSWVSQNFDH